MKLNVRCTNIMKHKSVLSFVEFQVNQGLHFVEEGKQNIMRSKQFENYGRNRRKDIRRHGRRGLVRDTCSAALRKNAV